VVVLVALHQTLIIRQAVVVGRLGIRIRLM